MTSKKSIKKQLIFLFIASIVITHFMLAIGFQLSIKYHFLKQDYQHIEDEVLNVFPNDKYREITQETLDYYALNKIKIWVVNDAQLSYKNSEVKLPQGSLPFLMENKDIEQSLNWEIGGDTYRAFSFSIVDGGMLVAGLKINDHLIFARSINWMILAFLSITAISAIAYGVFSVNRSLKPLKNFADYLSAISPEHLSVRIPAQQLPVELKELAEVPKSGGCLSSHRHLR